MAYTTIDDPSAHFQTKKYTGNGNSNHAITFDGNSNMQPDWVWNKVSSEADSHAMFDSSRGINKIIYPNVNLAEGTDGNGNIESFDSNGFTVGGNQQYANHDGATQITWAWKVNGGTTTTNDASATGVGTIDSVYQANTTSGVAIVTYTGTGSAGTIAHGLGIAPKMIITKRRDDAEDWAVLIVPNGNDRISRLNENTASSGLTGSGYWNDTSPTSTVFSVGSGSVTNGSSRTIVAYCFSNVQGFSKVGTYKGNGNADGAFIYTGFEPAFFMLKRVSNTGNWLIYDNKRDIDNPALTYLVANATDASSTASTGIDLLANGVKIRRTGVSWNNNDDTYMYLAFAQHPFVTSTGVPTTLRESG
tara:strand:+ start:287 stop:1369 length:1083 start_codon:yes stop_codon:yes gene_type:complete